jgi:hypothetical protein
VRLVRRSEYGLDPIVRSASGARRPPLELAPLIAWHWPGVVATYTGRDIGAVIRAIDAAARARPVPAPNEYNYVHGPDDDGLVYEYAGPFEAAHSAGENDSAVGELFLVPIGGQITDAQIVKHQWLRDTILIPQRIVRADVLELPHGEMPGAATQCPGPSVIASRARLIAPYQPPEEDDPNMNARPIVTTWAGESWPILVGYDPASATFPWRGAPDGAALIAAGLAVAGTAPLTQAQKANTAVFVRVG